MQEHLNDEQLSECLIQSAGPCDPEAQEHLAICPTCREEEERLCTLLVDYAQASRAEGNRAEAFWEWQQGAIAMRLDGPTATRRMAWVATAATLVLAAALLTEKPPAPVPAAERDPDQMLLEDVQLSVERELPRALEPAALLTAELSKAAAGKSNQPDEKKGEQR